MKQSLSERDSIRSVPFVISAEIMSKSTPERKNMHRVFADKCSNGQAVADESCQTKPSLTSATAFTSTQQSRAVSEKIPAISVGSSKLVRKHWLTGERHRLQKQATATRVSLASNHDTNNALPFQSSGVSRLSTPQKSGPTSPRNFLFETDDASQGDESITQPLTRNVTDEDYEYCDEQAEEEHRQDFPSAPQTPSSLDDDVSHPMRQVPAREECVNPVSRILWSKTEEEEAEPGSLMEESSFCVVSPAVILPKPSSVIAKPMAIRPMLLA